MNQPCVSDDLRHGRRRLATLVVVGHAVKHLYNSGLLSLLLPEIKIALGLSGAQFGSLLSARQVTSWGTTIVSGYVGDRFADKAPLMLGLSLGLLGVSFYVAGHVTTYWVMLIVMLLIGLGPSLFHPPALGELTRRFPDRRGFATSLHGTGGILGEILGPLIVAVLLSVLSWRGVMQWSIFPGLIAGGVIWGMMNSVRRERREEEGAGSAQEYFSSLLSLIRNQVVLILVIVTVMRSMADVAVAGFLPVFLRENLGFSQAMVAVYLSLSQVVGLGAQPCIGLISDHLGRKSVLIPGLLATSFLYAVLAFVDTTIALSVIVVCLGVFRFSLHQVFIAAALDANRGQIRASVVALIYGAGFLGTFSPYLAGLIADAFTIRSVFLYGGVITLIAAITMTVVRLPRVS